MEFDTIVIGGGPAGMFSAAILAENGNKVLLLEQNTRLGKKLLITGKGRCNVTNHCSSEEVLQNIPRNHRFLYSAMAAFPPVRIMDFLTQNGCMLKTERGNRVFPQSDQSVSVLNALTKAMKTSGVTVRCEKVKSVFTREGRVSGVKTSSGEYYGANIILATGGLSYPATGSTGDGYQIASELGHSIVPCEGSLVPLEISGPDCQEMQGLSLRNVAVKLIDAKGKILYKDFGELLFTHFGVSGPTVLSASAHLKGAGCKLVLDIKPALDEKKLDDRLLRDLDIYKNRSMENTLANLLPRSMIPIVLRRLSIDPSMQANSLTKQQRRNLVQLLKAFVLEIQRKRPVEEAIITSGGIKVSEVNPKTMESKLVKGLYFAGEILDCDGYTGGFNLQIAWATAYAAAMGIKNSH